MPTLPELLERRKILRTRDLAEAGVHPRQIAAALEAGILERPVFGGETLQGIYESPEACLDPDREACIATLLTGGVLAMQYAAQRHELAECMPDRVQVLVPHGRRLTPRPVYQLYRSRRPESFEVGVVTRETGLGVPVRMTSEARTVVDLVRAYRVNPDDYRIGHEAIPTYLDRGGTAAELAAIAERFEGWLPDHLHGILAAHSEASSLRYGA